MHQQASVCHTNGGAAGTEPVAALVRLDEPSSKPPIGVHRLVTVIGSKSDADIQLRSRHVSGAHCILVNLGNTLLLRDLASRTGVFVNDKRVEEVELAHGDTLRVGRFRYSVNYGRTSESSPHATSASDASLRSDAGNIPVNRRSFLIGRQDSADLHIDSELVSKAHAILVRCLAGWVICDLCSRSGTRVNGESVEVSALQDGDRIEIADEQWVFTVGPAAVEPIADTSLPGEVESGRAREVGAVEVDSAEPPAVNALGKSEPVAESPPNIPESTAVDTRPEAPAVQPRREAHPQVICRGWGPLAAAVAAPELLERIAISRRRAPITGQSGVDREKTAEPVAGPTARTNPRRFFAIALVGTVTCLGAVWFVISHPHFLAQLR